MDNKYAFLKRVYYGFFHKYGCLAIRIVIIKIIYFEFNCFSVLLKQKMLALKHVVTTNLTTVSPIQSCIFFWYNDLDGDIPQ